MPSKKKVFVSVVNTTLFLCWILVHVDGLEKVPATYVRHISELEDGLLRNSNDTVDDVTDYVGEEWEEEEQADTDPSLPATVEDQYSQESEFDYYDQSEFFEPSPQFGLNNIALNKNASQSSTYCCISQDPACCHDASRAVDGSKDRYSQTVRIPRSGSISWWKVDLGSSYEIEEIKIHNQMDRFSDNLLRGFVLMIYDAGQSVWNYTHPNKTPANLIDIALEPSVVGDEVKISLPSKNNQRLSLAEVEVYSYMQTSGQCPENPDDKFFKNFKDGGSPVFRKCAWLQTAKPGNLKRICSDTQSYGDRGPAREVCKNTCGTCNVGRNSTRTTQVPSVRPSIESVSPSFLPTSRPTVHPTASLSSSFPTTNVTASPTPRTANPSSIESASSAPSLFPTPWPSVHPTGSPSSSPSFHPSASPTSGPSSSISVSPTTEPTGFDSVHPTLQNSSYPTQCPEEPDGRFFRRFKEDGPLNRTAIYKRCAWLKKIRTPKLLESVCTNTRSYGGRGPAREVCKNSCGTCDLINSSFAPSLVQTTQEPSAIPSAASSLPSLNPTLCPEDPKDEFFRKFNNGNPLLQNAYYYYDDDDASWQLTADKDSWEQIPVYRTCAWLKNVKPSFLKKVCSDTRSYGGRGPAREVCKNSCGTCDLINSSPAPSLVQTTQEPSAIPSAASSLPSLNPTLCPEDPKDEFFRKFKNGNPLLQNAYYYYDDDDDDASWKLTADKDSWEQIPVYRTCAWLKNVKPSFLKKVCSDTRSYGGRGPAREVCKNTCNTCHIMNSSPAPSSVQTSEAPSASPSTEPVPLCLENAGAKFLRKYQNDGSYDGANSVPVKQVPVYRSCAWLRNDKQAQARKEICSNTWWSGSVGPARVVCKNTCGTCGLVNNSSPPSSQPSSSLNPLTKFHIISTYEEFAVLGGPNNKWCMQVENFARNPFLDIRICDPELDDFQKWFTDQDGQIRLVSHPNRCIAWEGQKLFLSFCREDVKFSFVYNGNENTISVEKLNGRTFQIGFDSFKIFGRLSLYAADEYSNSRYWSLENV